MSKASAAIPLSFCLALLPAQINSPPDFEDKPAFQKGAAAPLDSTSHISVRAEASATLLHGQLDRFAPAAPTSERQLFESAHSLLKERHLAAATEAFESAARGQFASNPLLAGMAITRFLSGRYDDGATALLELVRRTPRDLRLALLLGETAASVPARKPAYEAALRQFATQSKLGEPRYYLAQLLTQGAASPPAEAIALWKEAAALDQRDPRPCLELARATEQPQQALNWLHEALRRNANLPDAHYRLSRLYAKQGNTAKAAHHLERYRQLRQTQ